VNDSKYSVVFKIIEQARWAPSGDNTQPWLFSVLTDTQFEVHGFDTREHVVYDLEGHASQMAVGALLETIELAANKLGYLATIDFNKKSKPQTPVYLVSLTKKKQIKLSNLANFISQRTVQRRAMKTTPLSLSEKQQLSESLPDDFRVIWLESPEQKRRIAKIMYGNGKTRLMMKEGYDVHTKIIDWGKRFSIDKIPEEAVGVDPITAKVMRWSMANWKRYQFISKYLFGSVMPRLMLDFFTCLRCSAHFIIISESVPHSVEDYNRAGRAMQRFWLCATSMNLTAQPEQSLLIFSEYVNTQLKFSENSKAIENAENVDKKFRQLLNQNDFSNKVFMGRIGRGPLPRSRSLRKTVKDLTKKNQKPTTF